MIKLRPVYLTRVFDALSQLLNVLVLDGDANESISGRSYRQGWTRTERTINALLFWDEDHCRVAYLSDIARASALLNKE